jgi:hypothetical protein
VDTVGPRRVASSDEHFFEVLHSSHSHILVVRILSNIVEDQRTKVLTWVLEILLHPANGAGAGRLSCTGEQVGKRSEAAFPKIVSAR